MLILARKLNEAIVIDGRITVRVSHLDSGKVKLAIVAPPNVVIDREEIHYAKLRERQRGNDNDRAD